MAMYTHTYTHTHKYTHVDTIHIQIDRTYVQRYIHINTHTYLHTNEPTSIHVNHKGAYLPTTNNGIHNKLYKKEEFHSLHSFQFTLKKTLF